MKNFYHDGHNPAEKRPAQNTGQAGQAYTC